MFKLTFALILLITFGRLSYGQEENDRPHFVSEEFQKNWEGFLQRKGTLEDLEIIRHFIPDLIPTEGIEALLEVNQEIDLKALMIIFRSPSLKIKNLASAKSLWRSLKRKGFAIQQEMNHHQLLFLELDVNTPGGQPSSHR
jgi:hypothetical protein